MLTFYLGPISQTDSPVERSDNVADDEEAHRGDEQVVEVEPLKSIPKLPKCLEIELLEIIGHLLFEPPK